MESSCTIVLLAWQERKEGAQNSRAVMAKSSRKEKFPSGKRTSFGRSTCVPFECAGIWDVWKKSGCRAAQETRASSKVPVQRMTPFVRPVPSVWSQVLSQTLVSIMIQVCMNVMQINTDTALPSRYCLRHATRARSMRKLLPFATWPSPCPLRNHVRQPCAKRKAHAEPHVFF